jgi:protein gp37
VSSSSAIEWTEATWNPVTGCDRISPGCDNCYALALAARLKRMGQPGYQRDGAPRTSGPGFGVTLHPGRLDQPARWRRPRVVFVNSMSDLFHREVPATYIERVWWQMALAHQHTFQVLTKRPKRMRQVVRALYGGEGFALAALGADAPLPNVWLGTSIETNTYVSRADHLRATPAAVRFVSAEPLLGPLDDLELDGIDWLIAGGESGPGHRPVDPGWVRDMRDRCQAAGVAFFFKQWGGRTPKSGGRELDGRTWDEMPRAFRSGPGASSSADDARGGGTLAAPGLDPARGAASLTGGAR